MTILIVIAVILLSLAAITSFKPAMPPALFAYAGLWILDFSGLIVPDRGLMIFWGIVTFLAVIIGVTVPMKRDKLSRGYTWIGIGSLLGMVAGLYVYPGAGIIVGTFVGALIGYMIFRRTIRKYRIKRRFFALFFNLATPAIISNCIVGVALQLILDASSVTLFTPLFS
ncbi:MAG: DUF456 domain-containing protein [Muribaculaceae bacterium]|nr:DUF456 domain-containing protein [Muribaculaceae bacterium]